MDRTTRESRRLEDRLATEFTHRRAFLKVAGGGVLSATAMAIGGVAEASRFEPLWNSAEVLIGQSPADQSPSPVIECPLFFDNGQFADGFHTLDLSNLPEVRGTITVGRDTIEPNLSQSVAAAATVGSDGSPYLLVGGEGPVAGGRRFFRDVTHAIVRCKYRVADPHSLQLVACARCVVILVRE
jgi:hypothetical protein